MAAPLVSIGGIHLINSNAGAQTAGGSPTAAATSPFALGPGVRLDSAPQTTLYSGGPPFTLGARPVDYGYDNVRVTWPCNVLGTTHENAVALLQQLKQAIQRALFDQAALLAIQPTSSSTIMYAEVYEASVQELPTQGLIPLEGASDIDFELSFVRSPFFSPAGLTTLINGATFNNAGTGANNNTQSLGSPVGDLIYEGQPLNLKILPSTGSGIYTVLLATVYQRTYTGGTTVVTTSSTTGAVAFRDVTSGITNPARTRNGLRGRVLLRLTALSAKAQLQAQLVARQTDYTIWRGPWVQPGVIAGGAQVDLTPQGISLDAIRRAQLTSGDVDIGVVIRSTDGTSVSITPHSLETLLYYTYCQITTNTVYAILSPGQYLRIEQAQNLNGTAYLPVPGSAYLADLNVSEFLALACDVRGTLPLAISGASLYLSLLSGGTAHNTAHSAVVTVTHLPLWRTLRGT